MKAVEVVSFHSHEFEVDRKWDAEYTAQATGLLHAFRASEFLVAFYVVLKAMAVIKGFNFELQNRALDVVKAYTMVDEVIKELESFRREPGVFTEWFEQIESLAGTVGTSITIPRLTGKQVHHSNQPHDCLREY